MTTKKKVGLAGIMGMQSRPVEAPPTTQVQVKTQKSTQAAKVKTEKATKAKVEKPKSKALPKSKDKDFKLAGVYLRKTTVGQVKAKLELSDQDMSELVEDLLVSWLKKN